jgi:hypothetical protein
MHNQPNTSSNTFNVSNEELGIIRGLFELLVKLPNHIRYDTIAWAIERKDPSMLKLKALCQCLGLTGYIHYYFLTPEKFRKCLFDPKQLLKSN